MLFTLGLRRFPPIDVLLGIAAGKDPTSTRALLYLLSNISTHYINFDPAAFPAVAFLPAKTPTGDLVLAKPGQVFTNPDSSILGFAVAQPPINTSENAGKLKIPTDPTMERLVAALTLKPPQEPAEARAIFEVCKWTFASGIWLTRSSIWRCVLDNLLLGHWIDYKSFHSFLSLQLVRQLPLFA